MPSFFEPICAGIAVAIFNKYILSKLDPLAYCYAQCCHKDDDEDCVSSSSTSVVSDDCHVHHF